MPTFSTKKTLPYTAEQLFALVADIKAYPEFVLGILKTEVKTIRPNLLKATVQFGNRFYQDNYVCQVELFSFEKIKILGLEGPFSFMESEWNFVPNEESSKTILHFTVNFEFKNKLFQRFAEPLFIKLTQNMVQAFEDRAKKIYSSF